MISASRHRSWSSHQRPPPTFSTSDGKEDSQIPMYHEEVISDPLKQLAALERIDRQIEEKNQLERQKRELAEIDGSLDPNSASVDPSMAGEEGKDNLNSNLSASKSKKKPVSAKHLSEDIERKITNSTVAHITGGVGVKSWMTGSSALGAGGWKPKSMTSTSAGGSSLPAPKFAPQAASKSQDSSNDSNPNQTDQASSSSSSSPSSRLLTSSNPFKAKNAGDVGGQVGAWGDVAARLKKEEEEERKASLMVKMEDALFALEMEKSAGAGKGSGVRTLYKERAKPREKKPSSQNLNKNVGHAGPMALGLGLGLGQGNSGAAGTSTWQRQ